MDIDGTSNEYNLVWKGSSYKGGYTGVDVPVKGSKVYFPIDMYDTVIG